jgi:uncharacterized membrane protein YfcA
VSARGANAGRGAGVLQVALGALIGATGSLCGIGGGLFATPLQHYGLGVPLPRAVATSLAVVFCTATSSTLSEALRGDSIVPWTLALATLPGALLGTQLGAVVAQRLPVRPLKGLFCVVFLLVSARMLLAGEADSAAAEVGARAPLWVAPLLGLGAGVVVPVLGIGGGLLLVPGALFLAPDLGFAGARGFSLSVAVFTSARALWLRSRAGLVDLDRGLRLGAGCAAGALGGVALSRLPAALGAGQAIFVGILVLSAVRFGRDALRGQD